MACYEQYKPNEKTINFCKDEERLYQVADAKINTFERSFTDYIKEIHKNPQNIEAIKSTYTLAENDLNGHINNYKNLGTTIKAHIKSKKSSMQSNDAKFDFVQREISQKKNQYNKDYHSYDASTTLKNDIHKSKRYTFFNLGYYSIGTGLLIYFLYKQIKN
ncbi:MAG: hypothetical protein CML42_07540 [Rhodobacteraceae bacterium]|nr:hypothetical protein [Paracoccaceae bacterium]|tara:strand:+ start:6452 stop:6934 length:483 start_codon:yes stop_codon:yes gene_type:complete